jgi:hypothetical protein
MIGPRDDLFGALGLAPSIVSPRMLAELRAARGTSEDERVLSLIPPGRSRDLVHTFFVHFRCSGYAEILPIWESLAEKAIRRGWNLPLGCDRLHGWASGEKRGIAMSNDLRPFYIVALRIKRPDFAPYLEHSARVPWLLLTLEWSPFTEGRADV